MAGTRAEIAVPPPGSDSIASVPATRLTRWRIAVNPKPAPRPGLASAGTSKPTPSSRTSRVTSSRMYDSVRRARDAVACLATFASASYAVRSSAKDAGATINDVLLAGIAATTGRYLREHGSEVNEIGMMLPFNLRSLDEPMPRGLGNKFGLVFPVLLIAGGLAMWACVPWWNRLDDMQRQGHLVSWYWGGTGGAVVALMALFAAKGVRSEMASGGVIVLLAEAVAFLLFWAVWALRRRGPDA